MSLPNAEKLNGLKCTSFKAWIRQMKYGYYKWHIWLFVRKKNKRSWNMKSTMTTAMWGEELPKTTHRNSNTHTQKKHIFLFKSIDIFWAHRRRCLSIFSTKFLSSFTFEWFLFGRSVVLDLFSVENIESKLKLKLKLRSNSNKNDGNTTFRHTQKSMPHRSKPAVDASSLDENIYMEWKSHNICVFDLGLIIMAWIVSRFMCHTYNSNNNNNNKLQRRRKTTAQHGNKNDDKNHSTMNSTRISQWCVGCN